MRLQGIEQYSPQPINVPTMKISHVKALILNSLYLSGNIGQVNLA